jgi:hypothetical protein
MRRIASRKGDEDEHKSDGHQADLDQAGPEEDGDQAKLTMSWAKKQAHARFVRRGGVTQDERQREIPSRCKRRPDDPEQPCRGHEGRLRRPANQSFE